MTKREKLAEQAEALSRATAELTRHCQEALAKIETAEARRAEDHKASMATLDAIFDLIDNFGKPREIAKTDRPTGIAFVDGVGIRELKP
jgi:hypothetical protein